MLVEFKDQPELGIWRIAANDDIAAYPSVFIVPYDTIAGLVELAKYATISVRRSVLRLHRPSQKETLLP